MIEVTIPLSILKAIRLLAAKSDVRPYMNGVALSQGYIVAGNGHYQGAYRCELLDGAPEVIIPADVVDTYAKKVRGYHTDDVTVRWEELKEGEEDRQLFGWLTNGAEEERFALIGYVYPPFKRVMVHHTVAKGHPQFQWAYLALFEKVAETLGLSKRHEHKVFLLPNGTRSPARLFIHQHPEFEGVIAPQDWKSEAPVAASAVEDLV